MPSYWVQIKMQHNAVGKPLQEIRGKESERASRRTELSLAWTTGVCQVEVEGVLPAGRQVYKNIRKAWGGGACLILATWQAEVGRS